MCINLVLQERLLYISQYVFEKCKEQVYVHRHAMKAYGKEEYGSNHSQLWPQLEVSDQLHYSDVFSLDKESRLTVWILQRDVKWEHDNTKYCNFIIILLWQLQTCMSYECCRKCLCLPALRLDCKSREIKEISPSYVSVIVLHTVETFGWKVSIFLGGIYSEIFFLLLSVSYASALLRRTKRRRCL